jgi:ParB family chromosome partitioning protein
VTAAKFGISERHVMRLAAAGDAVRGEAGARLRQSGCTVRLNDLLALAKADPDSRAEAIERFAAGEVTRLSRALRAPVVKDPSDPVEEAFRALRAQWERAPEAARRRFVAEHHAALSTRVREETERRIIASKLGVAPDDERVDRVKANFGPRAGRAAS